MQAWQPAPPPGQNFYELSSVFSANGLTPQVYGATKPHAPRYNNSNHRPNMRNKRNNHDHRPHNSADPNSQQQQNQNVNPGHRSIQQPHHVSNQPPIPNQHNIIHNQSQQSLGASAVPMYKPATAIISSHGGSSAKSTDLYHFNTNKISKENSFSISNVPQIISSNNQQQQQHHQYHQQHQQQPQHQHHHVQHHQYSRSQQQTPSERRKEDEGGGIFMAYREPTVLVGKLPVVTRCDPRDDDGQKNLDYSNRNKHHQHQQQQQQAPSEVRRQMADVRIEDAPSDQPHQYEQQQQRKCRIVSIRFFRFFLFLF